jgi:plastocyanin
MDVVNSRLLNSQDGFLQLFAEADHFQYYLTLTPEGIASSHESPFQLVVTPGGGKRGSGKQHDVKVHWDGRYYVPTPRTLEISTFDYVIWHCERMDGSPPFAVRGKGQTGSFSSSALGPNAAYTHFFLSAGEVNYQVSGHGNYRITVTDHRRVEPAEYARRASELPVVHIRRGKPEPEHLQIVAGQTVIWTVEEDTGITIASVKRG